MRFIMRKCRSCGKYTLKDICLCGNNTTYPHPPRYSPQDRYGKYRRKLKSMEKD